MSILLSYIRDTSNTLASLYSLDLKSFFLVYILSFLPFYFGYFLMLYGSTRNLEWNDILKFRLKNKLQWNTQTGWGLYIHLFGRLMPYAYVLIFARNLPILVYIVIVAAILIVITLFIKKFSSESMIDMSNDFNIVKKKCLEKEEEVMNLWQIYDKTFQKVNIHSPCKQSFNFEDFSQALKDVSVNKYILESNGKMIGVGLITNNFKMTPWISVDYFKFNFPAEYSNGLIFYFIGLAINKDFRGRKYSIRLIEHIFDDLPSNSLIGFDHSRNINPVLHHFTKLIRQSKKITRNSLDKQHYHIVKRKNHDI